MCVITIISFPFILQTIARKVVANAAEEEEAEEEEVEEEEVVISYQPVVQQHNLTIRSTPFFHEFGKRCFHSAPMSQ